MKQSIAGIVYEKGKFLIGHRLPVGEMADRWEFPGGKVDPGETPEIAIRREFSEEMGVLAQPGEFIASVRFENRGGPVDLLAYRVTLSSEVPSALTEHTEVRWATFEEIQGLSFVDSDRLLFPAIREWLKTKA